MEQFTIKMLEETVAESKRGFARRKAKRENIIPAEFLTVGDQIAETDGYLFDVIEIVKKTAKTITVRLASDFSSIHSHWSENGGVLKTFRKETLLHGVII